MLRLTEFRNDQGMEWFEESHRHAVEAGVSLGTSAGAGGGRYALVLVSYGKCVYWIDQEKVILEKGDLLLLPPTAGFYGKSIPTIMHEKYVLAFEVSDPERLGLPLVLRRFWLKSKSGLYEYMLDRVRRGYTEWEERERYADVRAASIVLELLALWNRELDEQRVESEVYRHAERMKSYIQERYREKITKDELGDWISRSPNYAAAIFRQATGQTISEFVHAVRMKRAVYLLRDSLLTVAEIAEWLGYKDVSYFQRTFKRLMGATPSFYMKERRSGP
ncbi:helix-turn-helix domain-containing protein [Paenibacillus koleovorans]|uniref:helix-turn-helix domain-containing protein n=1 Tax=Paenibacillus koleovorans TaxID=121608 RepID=UPI000FDA1C0C|nr:AraC family transcriptional regulator [Paenibacillus koleovorans]